MIHSNKDVNNDMCLKVRNVEIQRVQHNKFLGILIDEKLNFNYHIDHVYKKLSRSYGIIRKIASNVPVHVIKKLYLTIVYFYLMYGVEAWGSLCRTSLVIFFSIQNKCVKLMNPQIANNVSEIYRCDRLLTFEKLYRYVILLKLFRYYILSNNEYFTGKVD
jgi:hypothetical protein